MINLLSKKIVHLSSLLCKYFYKLTEKYWEKLDSANSKSVFSVWI